jgi:CRISPR type IV-associated protein Csf3
MQAMQITAYVAGSIALARPEDLALDGILAYQSLRKHFGEEFYFLPAPKESLCFASLPLEMRGSPSERIQALSTGNTWIDAEHKDASLWYWACSSAQIDVKGHGMQHWNKRFDTKASLSDHIDFAGKREKILIEQGRYKSYHMPLPTLVCDTLRWYACGDLERVAELLLPVMAMGKKRAYGNGHVLRWEIVPMYEDFSEWRENCMTRPIPGPLLQGVEWAEPFNMQYMAYRAPQWHNANQALCVVGGKRNAYA